MNPSSWSQKTSERCSWNLPERFPVLLIPIFVLTKPELPDIIRNSQPPELAEMAIKINDIPSEGLTLEFDQKLDLFDKGTASTAFTAVLSIKPAGGGILRIAGRVQAAALLECSRCLKSFSFPIDSELGLELAPLGQLGTSPEHEIVKGELDREFYEGDEIEPLDIVKEQMLISLPMVPLHSPDCKGLCSVCGADLNNTECGHQRNAPGELGAFSALKDLLKK
jgi:uncharacterized protein